MNPVRLQARAIHIDAGTVANVTGELYPTGAGAVEQMLDMLSRQVASPVQFVKGLRTLYDEGGSANLTVIPVFSLLYSIPVVVLYLVVSKRYGFRFHGGIKS